MQGEIKEAMNQHRKTSGQSADGYSASKVIARLAPGKPHPEQHHDEEESQRRSDNPAI